MKLHDILTENTGEYIVYQVTSPHTDKVYYGYTVGEDPKTSFLGGAEREDMPDRGDRRFLQAAGEDVDSLRFKVVDVFDNEIEAFVERNEQRARDRYSITGPSNFPGQVFQRASKDYPERMGKMKMFINLNGVTAREAMGDQFKGTSKLTFDMLKQLIAANPKLKPQVMQDLDKMLYPDFMAKYFSGV